MEYGSGFLPACPNRIEENGNSVYVWHFGATGCLYGSSGKPDRLCPGTEEQRADLVQ